MTRLDGLFINQLNGNGLCVIFTEIRPNSSEIAHPVLEAGQFGQTKFEHTTAKDVIIQSLDIMARYVQPGALDLATGSEKYRRQSPLSRRLGEHITRFYGPASIIDAQLLIQNERCPIRSWTWVAAERRSRR
jgi:hypothetical protein